MQVWLLQTAYMNNSVNIISALWTCKTN